MAVVLGITNGSTASVQAMYRQVQHRGKDNFHTESLEGNFVATAVNAKDPVYTRSSGYHKEAQLVVAIAGAIYNQQQEPLSAQQIAQWYHQKGLTTLLQEIQGAYILCLLTPEYLHLVRDATGQRTVYYHQTAQQLAFCVESKGIQALPQFSPQLNVKALFQYFSYSFVPMQDTMLQGIKELPAGFCLSYHLQKKSCQLERFFKLECFEKHPIEDLGYWKERIKNAVNQEIENKLKDQKEVGIFLSGGLDSSIITAQIAQRHAHPVHTFSIHFGKKYPNELEYAQSVASRYQTIHHEVEIKPKDFVPNLYKTIWHLDDPIGDPITIPNFELAKYAAQHVPIIFNGEGSDPCFGGPKNIPMLLGHWYGGIEREKNFREKTYLASYRRGYKHLKTLLAPHLVEQLNEEEYLEDVLVPFFKEPRLNFLDKLMSINIRLKGAHLILPKVERMLGASGLPAVAPFFTQAVVQASMEMPSKYKLNKGIEKYILKEIFGQDLPISIIERPKSGMRVPVRHWFQGELKSYKKKLLHPKNIQQAGIFNPETIKLLLNYSNKKGLERHGLLTWMIMTFEIWRQIFIEKQTT
ncbi:MAG: asparagine synthetase B [Aureispira sp.]